MGTTTFNGAVRSEKGFQQINKADSTGVITARTLGMKPDLTSLTATAVATGTSLTYTDNVITINDFTAAAAQAVTLPAASVGSVVVHFQSKDVAHGTLATLSFDCAGSDVFRTDSKVETTSGAEATIDTSIANETLLTYTPVNAATNILTVGCYIYFTCFEAGKWNIATDFAKYTTATAGTFLFAS
jgi:hypothetical protein